MEFQSQIGQDQWVSEFFSYKNNGFFIDVGAHDGMTYSNTFFLEKELNWKGICVEASYNLFYSLKQVRDCTLVDKAIYSENKMVTFKENGAYGSIDPEGYEEVEAITMEQLLKNYDAPKIIDYISLDIEGFEYEALLGFPFNEYEVILWSIEHNLYGCGPTLKENIKKIMEANGYSIYKENLGDSGYPFEDWYINNKYLKQ